MTAFTLAQPEQALDPIRFPLWGSRLIEASAGTGKTWTIAALYLRLILNHGADAPGEGYMPGEILVMTFTRAATRELADRIRQRLIEAAACFRGEQVPAESDLFLQQLLAAYEGDAKSYAAWRLAVAAEAMDEASIHTLDAWCQRMLREHAFDSGKLFDEELVANERAMLTQAVQDYWREQVYPLDDEALAWVFETWGDVSGMMADVSRLIDVLADEPASSVSLHDCIQHSVQARALAASTLAQGWPERAEQMRAWLDEQLATDKSQWNGTKLRAQYYKPWLEQVIQWARNPQTEVLNLKAFEKGRLRLSPQGLLEARSAKAGPLELPPLFDHWPELFQGYERLPSVAEPLRRHAVSLAAKRMAQLKRQTGTFGFADLLQGLHDALAGPQGEVLRARILAQFPVALVDEFQDTSPLQYQVLDQLYRVAHNDPATALLLIGDPKQSIYGFRGADIGSYLAARTATHDRHYVLGVNHRSSQGLVQAVNAWFLRAEQSYPLAAFRYARVQQGQLENPLPFQAVQAKGRDEVFQTGQGLVPALQVHVDETLRSNTESLAFFSAHCAEQIVQWLNDPEAGFIRPHDQQFSALKPADIAVLVRTGTEAEAVRHQLRLRGLASVYLSDKDSVFSSQQAHDLWYWLRAVASPGDGRILRAAWATRLMGLSLSQLQTLASQDEAFDERAEAMRELHQVWLSQGVLAMLRQTLHRFGLPGQWLALPDGERCLTNYLHIAELLQQASVTLEGEQALVSWLGQQLQSEGISGEEQVLRLESDADLVKVITIHKSKGLEFPVVCLPFACSHRPQERRGTPFVRQANEGTDVTVGLGGMDGAGGVGGEGGEGGAAAVDTRPRVLLHYTDEDLARADEDRLREDIRLLYVAMTRPRHALWMGFSMLTKGSSKECKTHQSAAGYLVGGPEALGPAAYVQALQAFVEGQANLALHQVEHEAKRTPLAVREDLPPLLAPLAYTGRFDKRWAIGSFSGLVKALNKSASAPGLVLKQTLRPADDEALPEEPWPSVVSNRTSDYARLLVKPNQVGELAPVWHRLNRGALMGNFLHHQLEWLAGEGFDLPEPLPIEAETVNPLIARLLRRCERAGYGAMGEDIVQWLCQVVNTPLPPLGLSLRGLDQPLAEMEFWLPVSGLDAPALDRLCQAAIWPDLPRPALPESQLHGFLMGFADLVFVYEGRYWVLDYKSNALGSDASAYHLSALQAAVVQHRYDVQASLYLFALHRLLKSRLGAAYSAQDQLGGALVFFIRGLDGPEHGVVPIEPDFALLEGIDALFTGKATPC